MTINYPRGVGNKVILPTVSHKKNKVLYSNRGMGFEEQINQSNLYYLQNQRAVIYKKPTPIQVVHVDYPSRSKAVIKEAYFRQPSTTDYNGVYNGYYVDFEAKETKNKTAFPLTNFHTHQVEHMRNCLNQQGITFILFKFTTLNKVYLLKAQEFIHFWDNKENDRKSIPITYIQKYGVEIEQQFNPMIPYLDVIDQLIQTNNKF